MFRTGWQAFVTTFSLFAFAMAGANIWAELSPNLQFARTVASILVTAVLAVPAIVLFLLYDMRHAPAGVYRAWRWLWFFALLGYWAHSYWAVAIWFDWDFAQITRRQGTVVAGTNYALLLLWTLEILVELLLGGRTDARWVRVLQWLTHLLFVVCFVVAAIVFQGDHRTQASLLLGWTMAVSTGLALLVRLAFGDSSSW